MSVPLQSLYWFSFFHSKVPFGMLLFSHKTMFHIMTISLGLLLVLLAFFRRVFAAVEDDSVCSALSEATGKVFKLNRGKFGHFRKRRVYDFFAFNDETDMLEIRLNTLASVVDYFILVESPKTYQQRSKRLVYQDTKDRFLTFQDQIIHVVLDDLPNTTSAWEIEGFVREEGLRRGLNADPKKAVRDNDVVLVSDTDEILRPEIINGLKYCSGFESDVGETRILLRQNLYYYAFSWRHDVPLYWRTDAVLWDIKHPRYNIRRQDGAAVVVNNSGWHCSWCFKRMQQFRIKARSYSHSEHDQGHFLSRNHILQSVRNGLDLFNRSSETFTFVEPIDIPLYLKSNAHRYLWMLDRRGPTANFEDFVD